MPPSGRERACEQTIKGDPPATGFGKKLLISHHSTPTCYEVLHATLGIDRFLGMSHVTGHKHKAFLPLTETESWSYCVQSFSRLNEEFRLPSQTYL